MVVRTRMLGLKSHHFQLLGGDLINKELFLYINPGWIYFSEKQNIFMV